MGNSGMNPGVSRAMQTVRENTGEIHPVVSAVQFAAATRNGGSTMIARTGEVLPVGKANSSRAAYAVGGAKDKSGQRIKTEVEPLRGGEADIPLDTVLHHRRRIQRLSSSPDIALGSWDARLSDKPRSEIDIDATEVVEGRRQAKRLGKRRGEDAVYALHRGEFGKNVSTMRRMPPR